MQRKFINLLEMSFESSGDVARSFRSSVIGFGFTFFWIVCSSSSSSAQQIPAIPAIQTAQRGRLPISFRVKRNLSGNSEGLEIVSIDKGLGVLAGYSRPGVVLKSQLKPSDIITSFNGVETKNSFDLFSAMDHAGWNEMILRVDGVKLNTKIRLRAVNSPIVSHAAPQKGAKVYVVHMVDNGDEQIGENVNFNIREMKSVFDANVAKGRVAQYVLLSEFKTDSLGKAKRQAANRLCNASNLLETIQSFPISSKDSLFVYYQGHGGYSRIHLRGDSSGGHFLKLKAGDLLRADLVKMMISKKARMSILVTDCCNDESQINLQPSYTTRMQMFPVREWTRLESLLFCHSGFIDVTSASRGNLSWASKGEGGWFTKSFLTSIQGAGDSDEGKWENTWPKIKDEAAEFYRSQRKLFLDRDVDHRPQLVQQLSMPSQEFHLDVKHKAPSDPPGYRQIPFIRSDPIYKK